MINRKLSILCAVLVLIIAWSTPSDAASALKIGVLSFAPKAKTLERWKPLTGYLERRLNVPFVVMPMNYTELHQAVDARTIDFIVTNPGDYIYLGDQGLVSRALATMVNSINHQAVSYFGGTIVTRADQRTIRSLNDLQGKRIAAVSKHSLGGYQMQLYELLRAGVNTDSLTMIWTEVPHDRAIQAVLDGKADAAFVRTGVLERMLASGAVSKDQLRVINAQPLGDFPFYVSTRLYPEWPIAALPQVEPELINRMTAALLLLQHDGASAQSMGLHGFDFAANYEGVRDMMREIGAPPFERIPEYILLRVWHLYQGWVTAAACALLVILLLLLRLRVSNVRLAESRNQMDALIESTLGVVFRCLNDAQWTMQFLSQPAMDLFGYPVEDFIGNRVRSYSSVIYPDDRARVNEVVQQALAAKESFTVEYRIIHRQGNVRWVLEKGVGEYDEQGTLLGIAGTISNHTAEHRLQALHLEQEKYAATVTLIGGIAHHFNNILSAITGHLFLAGRINAKGSETAEHLERIDALAMRMAGLIRPLLIYIEHDHGKMEVLDFIDLTRTIVAAHDDESAAPITIEVQPGVAAMPVQGLREQLEESVRVFISNALDAVATVAAPKITLRLSSGQPSAAWLECHITSNYHPEREYLCLQVDDNGTGITEADLPHILEPFFTTKDVGKGFGLGLSFAAGAIRKMDGFLGFDSSEAGTTVRIYLPLHHPAD